MWFRYSFSNYSKYLKNLQNRKSDHFEHHFKSDKNLKSEIKLYLLVHTVKCVFIDINHILVIIYFRVSEVFNMTFTRIINSFYIV